MSTSVFDLHQQSQVLGSALARGGEGTVYPLAQRPDLVVKRYHDEVLDKRRHELERKVEAMRTMSALKPYPHLAWPLISVYDDHQDWIGYAMYRAQGVPLFNLAHALLYKKHFPGLDRRAIVDYLLSLISHLHTLHQHNVYVGDYNLHNILCQPGSDHVALIDCDSYQVSHQGQWYPCPVGSADLTAKEQQGQPFSHVVRTAESEAFSLAMILFKCLMLGRHPYDIVGGDDPVTNLQRGHFAYGIGNRGIPKGAWYNIWSHMPHRIKTLFVTTFTDGADDPTQRATLSQWQEVLTVYRKEIDKGWHEAAIRPQQPKSREYNGSLNYVAAA